MELSSPKIFTPKKISGGNFQDQKIKKTNTEKISYIWENDTF